MRSLVKIPPANPVQICNSVRVQNHKWGASPMSLMKTLAKVAIGVAEAKGAKAVMNNRAGGGTS